MTLATSLARRRPKIAAEWHPTHNGALQPSDVTIGSPRSVWWRCSADPSHEWTTTIRNRTADGRGCPYCSGHRPTAATCLAARYPLVAAEWHPSRNGSLTAQDVLPRSSKKVWWRCQHNRQHVWLAVISNRTQGTGCPDCRTPERARRRRRRTKSQVPLLA
jgi:hypothetical protein